MNWDLGWLVAAACSMVLVLFFGLLWKAETASKTWERLVGISSIVVGISILISSYIIPSHFSPRATVTGRVVQSRVIEGRPHVRAESYINIESSDGRVTQVRAPAHVVQRIELNRGVRASYLVWTSQALTIDISIEGVAWAAVFDEPDGPRLTRSGTFVLLVLYFAFGVYAFRAYKSVRTNPA